ncbi:MAG TPA: GGDEF domain-containing protein [Gemmatimonadaceae bacterium]|nr:GGDEF domain-containing protein [Gemmatimonadaceae bacterium]
MSEASPVPLAPPLEILRWHVRWRLIVAVVTAVVMTAFQVRGWFAGDPVAVVLILAAYLAVVGAAASAPSKATPPGTAAAVVTVLADVVAIMALAAVTSHPGHHDWVLLAGFFVVHLAQYSFGYRTAAAVVAATVIGFGALISLRAETPPRELGEAAFSVMAFLAVTATFMAQYASRRRRLRRIIALFQHAEQGDFSDAYDVAADRHADAVTAVGGAYNQVRHRLGQLVLTDPLTGCLNRRGFEQAIERELGRASRSGGHVALLALDIDYFKQINDSYGHLAGDDVLRQLGGMLFALVRAGDLVARSGGDEFFILCPDATPEGAAQLATRLCDKVRTHDFDGQGTPIELTVSVGIASVDLPEDGDMARQLQRRADRALYEAKRAGRNRAYGWTSGGAEPRMSPQS